MIAVRSKDQGSAGGRDLQHELRKLIDPMVYMRRIVSEALVLVPAAEGAVIELAQEGQLSYVCTAGRLDDLVGRRVVSERSFAGLALAVGETLHATDARHDQRVSREEYRRVKSASIICVPLYRSREAIGVLMVTAAKPGAFDDGAVSILRTLADVISETIAATMNIARMTAQLLDDTEQAVPAAELGAHAQDGIFDHHGLTEFLANVLRPGIVADSQMRQRIERVLGGANVGFCYQPIVDLDRGTLVGVEMLARFSGLPKQPPDAWFDQAHLVGRGVELELMVLAMALELVDDFDENAYVAVNVGPGALRAEDIPVLLAAVNGHRVVLELTEHVPVDDYRTLQDALSAVRGSGARLAIDDTGAGFASLVHILNLGPDIIKLDRSITRGVDRDPVRSALASALVSFAAEIGAEVTAEGIETQAELDTVRALGIRHGQGYLLGMPTPIAAQARRVQDASRVRTSSEPTRGHASRTR